MQLRGGGVAAHRAYLQPRLHLLLLPAQKRSSQQWSQTFWAHIDPYMKNIIARVKTGTLARFPGDAGKRIAAWPEQRIASVNFRKEVFAVLLFSSLVLAVLGFLCIAGRRDDPKRRS
jgi:hypothetical protein